MLLQIKNGELKAEYKGKGGRKSSSGKSAEIDR